MFFRTYEEKVIYVLSLILPFWLYFNPLAIFLWLFIAGVIIAEDMMRGEYTYASNWTGFLMPVICWGVFLFTDLPKFILRIFLKVKS